MRIAKPLVVALLALSSLLAGCQSKARIAAGDADSLPSATHTPSAAATSMNPAQLSAPTATPEFKRISPSSIVRMVQSEATIEAFLFARESCLRLEIRTSGFQWGPGVPRESRMIQKVAFLDPGTGSPLRVEQLLQGGGGGGGEGLPVTMEEMFIYDLKSPIVPTGLVAVVTFHEALGITQPVRFDLEPVSRPNMYCPQLPLTTPEA